MTRDLRSEVDELVREGVPFTLVEDYIEELPASAERKSALWLYAFAIQPRDDRVTVAHTALADAELARIGPRAVSPAYV